ncbi:hypothetical protein HanRHA438_Chr13g0627551 [Helianthus annuus]|nr:hypothetical protein HanRHA438_Chr13g0627551 [Helianthus annuus]
MFYYRINAKLFVYHLFISSIYEHNHENHGFDPETRTYNWYQSHGARFSKTNRLLSHMCSRSVIFVGFCTRCKKGENEKNSDLDPNIQICDKTSVGFCVFLLNLQVFFIKNCVQVFSSNLHMNTVAVFLLCSKCSSFLHISKDQKRFNRSDFCPRKVIFHFE